MTNILLAFAVTLPAAALPGYNVIEAPELRAAARPGAAFPTTESLLGDAAIHFRLSQRTSVALGALLWIENAGSNARTPSVPEYCFGSCSLGPKTVPLPTHPGWFTVTWVVPSVSHVDVIGIQVGRHGSGKFTLAIDALSWTGS